MKLIRSVLIAVGLWILCANVAVAQGVGFRYSEYTVGAGPQAVVVADFDGDGKLDVAAANSADNTISILPGVGDGTFGAKTDFPTGAGPVGIVAADLDGDGKLDLATANNSDNKVSILLGKGDGTFGLNTDFATGTEPAGIAVGDFNGDGVPDLATANRGGDDISILPGLGGGVFGPNVNYAAGRGPVGLVVGDFNGDNRDDVAALAVQSDAVSVLLGNGDGTFGPKMEFSTGGAPWSLAKGDFNGDGKLDLVVANYNGFTASILLGKGDGTFDPKADLDTDDSPLAVTVADFDADGKSDFLTVNGGFFDINYSESYSPTVSLLLGNGDGTFRGRFDFSLRRDAWPAGVATGDFNGDGRIDVLTAYYDSWGVYDTAVGVLLQSAAVTPSPASVSFGTQQTRTSSVAQTVTLNSTGSFPAIITSVAPDGTDAGQFTITADTCSGNTVPSESNCTINVAFSPASAGNKSAYLVITDDAAESPQLVWLTGTGIAPPPGASLVPPSVTFNPQLLNTTSPPQDATLTNTGGNTLTITSIGTNSTEFDQTNNCGSTLAPGASCAISLTFRPSATGTRTASLSINSNASNSPQVTLFGEGSDFSVGVPSSESTTITVNKGGSATYTLSIGGVDGFSGIVTLGCTTSSPAAVSCTVPPSVNVTGAAATNVTLTVSATTQARAPFRGHPRVLTATAHSVKPITVAWLLLLLVAVTRHRRIPRAGCPRLRLRTATALVGLVLCAQLWSGCGGGSTPPPARTYQATVNASSSGVLHTINLTVNVP